MYCDCQDYNGSTCVVGLWCCILFLVSLSLSLSPLSLPLPPFLSLSFTVFLLLDAIFNVIGKAVNGLIGDKKDRGNDDTSSDDMSPVASETDGVTLPDHSEGKVKQDQLSSER